MEKTLTKRKAPIAAYIELFREIQFAQLKGINYHLSRMQSARHIAKDFTKDDIPDLTSYPLTEDMAIMLRDDIRNRANARRNKPAAQHTQCATSVTGSEQVDDTVSADFDACPSRHTHNKRMTSTPVQLSLFDDSQTPELINRFERLEQRINCMANLLAGIYRLLNDGNE